MSTVQFAGETRIVMHDIAWDLYSSLADTAGRAGRRITYDRGEMEIMSPSRAHEIDKAMLGRMIERFAELQDIDISSSSSTTFKRRDLDRGFEPDESFYIQNERAVREKTEADLSIDPPPDLVIEVERSRSSLNKLALFAEFGVPEVWRYDGETLSLHRLSGGGYEVVTASVCLPGFPNSVAQQILQSIGTASETKLIQRFVSALETRKP